MKKGKIVFGIFVILIVGIIGFGIYYVYNNVNVETYIFANDGYVIQMESGKSKADVFPFAVGSDYNYKKYNDKITFVSNSKEKRVDNSSVIHYNDGGLTVLKNTVALNLDSVDNSIIFYYNIFKNTKIEYENEKYVIKSISNNNIEFNNMLMRINDNKFLIAGKNVRIVFANEEIVNLGDFAYFEYDDGIVKIYDNDSYYQALASDATLVVGECAIELDKKIISKQNVEYITLSNLVIDMDSNIDVIVPESEDLEVKEPDITNEEITGGEEDINNGSVNPDSINGGAPGDIGEEVVDNTTVKQEPIFNVTNLDLSSLNIDAKIEINDPDFLLSGPVELSIVENATARTVYDSEESESETMLYVSYADLKPDTEYTLYAKADYEIDDIDYEKTFVAKIFRTEALGVTLEKSYATQDSITVSLTKESYSGVSSATLTIYDADGKEKDTEYVKFSDTGTQEITFDELDSNAEYTIKMYDIQYKAVTVEDGFTQSINVSTLKKAPDVSGLGYSVSKSTSSFNLRVNSVKDPDYGIVKYRYEVYDAREFEDETPILTLESDNLNDVSVLVDDVKLNRGVAYTYRLIVEFFDNEKTIEYAYNLGSTMQLDGVAFPTLRFDETKVTWEQIQGTIIINDTASAIVSDKYKIIYKNSIDVYKALELTAETTSDSIPILVNGLRANETYTFDVYADINLQDGNDTASETYIGSVQVQTKEPNPLKANFESNISLVDPFSIEFKLSDPTDMDSSFEASTLSELTLTLYEGSTTNSNQVVSKRTLDTNVDPYVSTVKSTFYDKTVTINPSFFERNNSQFEGRSYTLVVSNALDYTSYKNPIEIQDNTFTFTTNGYVPSIPEETENAFEINKITNKEAKNFGLEPKDELDPNTIVGLQLLAKYDNSSLKAKHVIYHVWVLNPETKEFEEIKSASKTESFKENGMLEPVIYSFGEGTAHGTFDSDELRRGNTYYFTYEINLDMDGDDKVDHVYPTDVDKEAVIKSANQEINKQEPKFKLYPSSSNGNTFTWKYQVTDIDNALYNKNLYGYSNDVNKASSSPTINVDQESFQSVTFTSLTTNKDLTIKNHIQLLKGNEPQYKTLTSQYFYGSNTLPEIFYTVTPSDNKLVIQLQDMPEDLSDRVIKAEVIIKPNINSDSPKETSIFTNLDNNFITVDYIDIKEYLSVSITVDVKLYYDSGIIGYDVDSTYVALQNASSGRSGNYYKAIGEKLSQNSIPADSLFKKTTFNDNNPSLTLNGIDETTFEIPISIESTGVNNKNTNNNIILKKIESMSLKCDEKVISFDLIIPGISILDEVGKPNIIPYLSSVKLTAQIINLESVEIQDNKIHLELYTVDENGRDLEKLGEEIEKDVSDFKKGPIEIPNLMPGGHYAVKFYANVRSQNQNNKEYKKNYLYDVNTKKTGETYYFDTLSKVGISAFKAVFSAKSYKEKKLNISFNLDTIIGFDSIEYKLYKCENDDSCSPVDIEIESSKNFSRQMSFDIEATPNEKNEITYGKKYKLEITPKGQYSVGEEKEEYDFGTTSFIFTIPNYKEPFVGISSGKTEESIYFRVTVSDLSFLVPESTYTAELFEGEKSIKKEEKINISEINKMFEYKIDENSLQEGKNYKFVVTINVDYENNTKIQEKKYERTTKIGNDATLGNISATQVERNKLRIIFNNSYKITEINKMDYTIFSISSGFYKTANDIEFQAIYDPENYFYYYEITFDDEEVDKFNVKDTYLITLNFYPEGEDLIQYEISFYNGGTYAET